MATKPFHSTYEPLTKVRLLDAEEQTSHTSAPTAAKSGSPSSTKHEKAEKERVEKELLVAVRPKWKEGDHCYVCNDRFDRFLRRRHHCRNCGALCCQACSAHKARLLHFGYTSPERVCTPCWPFTGQYDAALAPTTTWTTQANAAAAELVAATTAASARNNTDEINELVTRGSVRVAVLLASEANVRVKICGIRMLCEVAKFKAHWPALIKHGAVHPLQQQLRHGLQDEVVVDVARALWSLAKGEEFRAHLVSCGVFEACVLRLVEDSHHQQIMLAKTLLLLMQSGAGHWRSIGSDTVRINVVQLLAVATTADKHALLQETLLCVVAHISTSPQGAMLVWQSNCASGRALQVRWTACSMPLHSLHVRTHAAIYPSSHARHKCTTLSMMMTCNH